MDKSDLFNLNYYKLADFTGSKGSMCYRISLENDEEERFCFELWKGPLSGGLTQEEKQVCYFPYTDEGLEEMVKFIEEMKAPALKGSLFEEVMKERE